MSRSFVKSILAIVLLTLFFVLPLAANAETSGTCGPSLTWVLDDEGTLTISGTGKMHFSKSNHPWKSDYVKTVIIEPGVTSIADGAFSGCTQMTSISLPDSLTNIGKEAFFSCSSLSSVCLPEGLTQIGDYTFCYCSALTDVTIPESLSSIGAAAFRDCTSLTDIAIPDGVTSIGECAFDDCPAVIYLRRNSAAAIALSAADYAFVDLEYAQLSLKAYENEVGTRSFQVADCVTEATSISFPEGVTSIGSNAFASCNNLTSIIVPEGVTSIGYKAFYFCKNLVSVTLPDSLVSIKGSAFDGCTSLTDIRIPEGVTEIGKWVFTHCPAVLYADRYSELALVMTEADLAFVDVEYPQLSLLAYENEDGTRSFSVVDCVPDAVSVTFPEGVTSIEGAFYDCELLRSVHIPDGVTRIGGSSFWNCESLQYVSIPASITSIGPRAFEYCRNLPGIKLPTGLTSIGEKAFLDCSRLTSINIPEGVTEIGYATFYYCSSLRYVSFPSTLEKIGERAFEGVRALKHAVFYGDKMPSGGYLGVDADSTVYCYEFSEADFWAAEKGCNIVYLDAGTSDVRSITLPESLTLNVAETCQIDPAVIPENIVPALIWTSSDPSVATVDQNGLVTALKRGETTITVSCGDVSEQMHLTVRQDLKAFDLSETEVWLVSKESIQLSVENVTPPDAETDFKWSSSDTAICTVSNEGLLKALRPGTAIVTVTSGRVSRTCTVYATYPVTGIAFTGVPNLYADSSCKLTVEVTARDQTVVNKLVTFSSSDESVATVDQNGVVHAVGTGSVTITATAANGVSESCMLTVKSMVRSYLPADLVHIEAEAFEGTSAECYVLPDGVLSIGPRAFANCTSLLRLEIPASVTSIAADAFQGCNDLTIVAPEGSVAHVYAVEHGIAWIDP